MSISFDSALGIHDNALLMRAKRSAVLAQNIANADTPGFKARDLDFGALLKAQSAGHGDLNRTNARHIGDGSAISSTGADGMAYRIPLQPSVDGNTVELDVERAEFARNALQFQTSFTILNGRFRGLITAIKGE